MSAMRCRPRNLKTLQGEISFDENGDIKDRTVSVFQYKHDDKVSRGRLSRISRTYIGAAPQS